MVYFTKDIRRGGMDCEIYYNFKTGISKNILDTNEDD